MATTESDRTRHDILPDKEVPRTELGRRLRELRRKIVGAGVKLLSKDEIDVELASRRGEQYSGD